MSGQLVYMPLVGSHAGEQLKIAVRNRVDGGDKKIKIAAPTTDEFKIRISDCQQPKNESQSPSRMRASMASPPDKVHIIPVCQQNDVRDRKTQNVGKHPAKRGHKIQANKSVTTRTLPSGLASKIMSIPKPYKRGQRFAQPIENQLVNVEKAFELPDPKAVVKTNSAYSTNFRLINQMINHRSTINAVKSQSVLNKTVENNFAKIRHRPRQVITYGNQLKSKQTKRPNGNIETTRFLTSVLEGEPKGVETYDIKRLDYLLVARKIDALEKCNGNIFSSNTNMMLDGSLFGQVQSYYLKAIRKRGQHAPFEPPVGGIASPHSPPVTFFDEKAEGSKGAAFPLLKAGGSKGAAFPLLKAGGSKGAACPLFEADRETVAVLLQEAFTSLSSQHGFPNPLRASVVAYRDIDQPIPICETGFQQEAGVLLVNCQPMGRMRVVLAERDSAESRQNCIEMAENQYLRVPQLTSVVFDPEILVKNCILLIFSWGV